VKTPMPHPEQPEKKFNLFLRRMMGQTDFTEQGVINSEAYGAWNVTALHGRGLHSLTLELNLRTFGTHRSP